MCPLLVPLVASLRFSSCVSLRAWSPLTHNKQESSCARKLGFQTSRHVLIDTRSLYHDQGRKVNRNCTIQEGRRTPPHLPFLYSPKSKSQTDDYILFSVSLPFWLLCVSFVELFQFHLKHTNSTVTLSVLP